MARELVARRAVTVNLSILVLKKKKKKAEAV